MLYYIKVTDIGDTDPEVPVYRWLGTNDLSPSKITDLNQLRVVTERNFPFYTLEDVVNALKYLNKDKSVVYTIDIVEEN